jgi:hypothetical protein
MGKEHEDTTGSAPSSRGRSETADGGCKPGHREGSGGHRQNKCQDRDSYNRDGKRVLVVEADRSVPLLGHYLNRGHAVLRGTGGTRS